MANKNASWSKPKSESAIFQWLPSLHTTHYTGLWKILGANWSSWRRGGRIWQTLVILNWNMTNSHYFELKWIPTFTCRKFLECNTSISLDCADGWALENEIIYLYFDLSKTSVLNLVIHFFKEWNQLLRNFWNLIYPARSQPTME